MDLARDEAAEFAPSSDTNRSDAIGRRRLPGRVLWLLAALIVSDPTVCVASSETTSAPTIDRFHMAIRLGESARDRGSTVDADAAASEALDLGRPLGPRFVALAEILRASIARGVGEWNRADEALRAASTAGARADSELEVGQGRIQPMIDRERGLLAEYQGDSLTAGRHFETALAGVVPSEDPILRLAIFADLARLARSDRNRVAFDAAEDGFFESARDLPRDATVAGLQIALLLSAEDGDDDANRVDQGDGTPHPSRRARRARLLGALLAAPRASLHAVDRAWALALRATSHARAGRFGAAERDLREAQRVARLSDDREATVRFEARLGRLEAARGNSKKAVAILQEALEGWRDIRAAKRVLLPEARAFGRALLRDLVDHQTRLARSAMPDDPEARRRFLASALENLDRLRSTELRDYFRDDCVDAYQDRTRSAASLAADAIVLYPVALANRIELLVSWRDEILQFSVDVDETTLREKARELRFALPDRTLNLYRRSARELHDWLIAPIEPMLEERGIRTIVFVPGDGLRAVPIASLYDGESFLVERYAIATIPALELVDARPIAREGNLAFLGGVAESVDGFAALPHVPAELRAVAQILEQTSLALDERFESEAIRRELGARDFNIVHLATHGSFGSTAAESYLLARDKRIDLDELADWIGAFRYRERPLQLMVLSACESAVGDEQAALGFSGIAVKAGAQSALGTMWSVNDAAASEVVTRFYRGLIERGLSRAEALRAAQQAMISNPEFAHPYYWAPFLLLNAWI